MDLTSTPTKQARKQKAKVSDLTLTIIRQFARSYMPVPNMPGLILN